MYCQSVNLAIHISSDFNPTDKHRSCFTSPTVLTYCTTCFFGGGRHSSFHSLILWLLGVLPRFLGSLFWEMLVADLSASVVLRELLAACIERSRQIGAEHTCTFYTACPHTWHTCTTSICPNRAQLLAWGMFQQGQHGCRESTGPCFQVTCHQFRHLVMRLRVYKDFEGT